MKKLTFSEFKRFLAKYCYDERLYGDGKYDHKIYDWFDLGKPTKIEFYTAEKWQKQK